MTAHSASCRCGALHLTATGEPVRISICHCLECQKRSGSAFAAQVRFPADTVTVVGETSHYAHEGASGVTRFHYCPSCGTHVFYRHDFSPETIAILLGTLDDPKAFTPQFSMFENRKHPWLAIIGEDIEHD